MWGRTLGNCQDRATHLTTFWLCVRGGLKEGTTLLPGFWRFVWPLPSKTGTLPADALVLNPRQDGSAYVLRPCWPFKQSLLKIWPFLPLHQLPLVFTARRYGGIFLVLKPWAVQSGLVLRSVTTEVSFPIFIHHTWIKILLQLPTPSFQYCSFHHRYLAMPHCISMPLCPTLHLCPSYLSR